MTAKPELIAQLGLFPWTEVLKWTDLPISLALLYMKKNLVLLIAFSIKLKLLTLSPTKELVCCHVWWDVQEAGPRCWVSLTKITILNLKYFCHQPLYPWAVPVPENIGQEAWAEGSLWPKVKFSRWKEHHLKKILSRL